MREYNKLVRDKIPEIIEANHNKCNYHIAENNEVYQKKLYEKFIEEFEEFKKDPSIEEYIDIIEVLEAMAKFHNIDLMPMRQRKRMKRQLRGGFDDRIILDSTELMA
jgi:predicted house-cleaning noncanonical NTP pyrophosphatase (MazG superfamily)